MPEHKIGSREEWRAARDELAKLEAEHAQLGRKVTEQRRRLPWVPADSAGSPASRKRTAGAAWATA